MGMRGANIDPEFLGHVVAKRGFRQHAFDRLDEQLPNARPGEDIFDVDRAGQGQAVSIVGAVVLAIIVIIFLGEAIRMEHCLASRASRERYPSSPLQLRLGDQAT